MVMHNEGTSRRRWITELLKKLARWKKTTVTAVIILSIGVGMATSMRRLLPSGRNCGGWWYDPRQQAEDLSLRTQRTVGACSAVCRSWWLCRVWISLRLLLVSTWTSILHYFYHRPFAGSITTLPSIQATRIKCYRRPHHTGFRTVGRSGRSFCGIYSSAWLRSWGYRIRSPGTPAESMFSPDHKQVLTRTGNTHV